jgi:hypothetical protein
LTLTSQQQLPDNQTQITCQTMYILVDSRYPKLATTHASRMHRKSNL